MENEAATEKVRITHERIAEWRQDAAVLLDANCKPADAVRDLRARGCTPKLAEQIVMKAHGPVRAQHRRQGLGALVGGGALALLGMTAAESDLLSGFWLGGRLPLVGVILGLLVAALGALKLLTGNAVDIEDTVLRPRNRN